MGPVIRHNSSLNQSKLDRFESRQQSSGVNSRFNVAVSKARAINTVKDIGHSKARTKARLDYNKRLSSKLQENLTASINSSPSGNSSLSSFESKLQQKKLAKKSKSKD